MLTQKEINEKREVFCQTLGNKYANPIIRSMYPSKSRGEMAKEFEQAAFIAWNTRELIANEQIAELEKSAKAEMFILQKKIIDLQEFIYETSGDL